MKIYTCNIDMINYETEFQIVIGLKLELFRLCEGWTVYGVGWQSVGSGKLSNLGLFSDRVFRLLYG